MTAILRQIDLLRTNGMLGQLVRFGIVGLVSTGIYSAIYLPLSAFVFRHGHAVFAVPFAFGVSLVAGYFLHSAWSFKGHGTRRRGATQPGKFLVVQSFGLVLNSAFTWVLTAPMHEPNWTPLVPIIFVTPLATFFLNRKWVFG